jgi:hypothetical protein
MYAGEQSDAKRAFTMRLTSAFHAFFFFFYDPERQAPN